MEMNTNNKVDFSDRLGVMLLKKGVVNATTLEKAIKLKESAQKNGRSLAQILVKDFNVSHDAVYQHVIQLYGFRQVALEKENIDDNRINFMRKMLDPMPDAMRTLMKEEKILVYKYDEYRPYVLIILAADPTNKHIANIARSIGAKRYEVCYVKLSELESLLEKIYPEENLYLKEMDDMALEIEGGEVDGEGLDEEAIEAEINKSLLVNLVEGMLVEAVRRGASDIHIIPKSNRTSEIHMRVDGYSPFVASSGGC